MDRIIPWGEWKALIQPYYYKGERGNKPYDLELMLRIYLLQNLYDLSDMATVAEVIDSRAFSEFCGVDSSNQVPDGDTLGRFRHILEENGIQFLLSDSAVKFEKNTAFMKSGKTVEFDVLVLAVGVRANTAPVKEAGGEVNRGILVNDSMETSISGIYAAGDCTEGNDISLGARRVLAIMPNAYLQGQTAGVNMAGGKAVFNKAIPMNSIGFFGLHIMSAGTYDGEMTEEQENGSLKRFFVKDGFLKGFILIGKTERAGIYTSLIREKTPLDTIDFESSKKLASNSIFSPQTRRKKFGGVV